MRRLSKILRGMYARLLSLYPRTFRDEYGAELRDVYEMALRDAARRGVLAVAWLGWREMRDLPGAVARQHLSGRAGARMESIRFDEGPATWKATLAGILPFLVWGAVPSMTWLVVRWAQLPQTTTESISWVSWVSRLCILIVGFAIGWAKGFPRWSYPYVGVALTFPGVALAMTPLLAFVDFSGGYWISFVLAVALLLLLARAWRLLRPLYEGVRSDWTQLSFCLYTTVLTASSMVLETIPASHDVPWQLASHLIATGGALVYMRSRARLRRVSVLLVSVTLAMMVVGLCKATYFDWLSVPGKHNPAVWWSAARATGGLWGWLAVLILGPAMLEFFPSSPQRVPQA